MIRVLIVDDHPSVRVGLVHVLAGEPGLVPVAAATDAAGALQYARRAAVHVAVVDYHLGGEEDGLLLGLELKQLDPAPGVVIYSGRAQDELVVGAHLVQANAVLGKGAPVEDLYDAVKLAARGERRLPELSSEATRRARERLPHADGPLFERALAGEPLARLASALRGGDVSETRDSLRRMIASLAPRPGRGEDPAPAWPG